MKRELLVLSAAALAPASALAQMSCAALGSYLASQPHISPYVPPPTVQVPNPAPLPFTMLVPATNPPPPQTPNAARCEANFIYSARGGPANGYAVGQDQRIGIRVGFPLNSADNGGAPSPWNGKVRNIGGGGLQGGLSSVAAATNTRYVGSNTDTGHPTQDNPGFAVIQATHELNFGRLDDFLVESIHQQYKWALALTEVYYGQKATRNYWDGCSTGGREGLSMALHYGEDFDGFLTGAPANYHTRLQLATVWPFWVQKEITGTATLTQAKMNAANVSAVAACDAPGTAQDGVADGVLGDPRTCKFDAKANICGMPGAPATNCLTAQEADAVNRIWDGPRNDRGKRIWFAFGRGANAGVTNSPPFGGPGGSLGIFTWSHRDNNYNFTGEPLSQFDDEAELATNVVAPYSDIMSTDLEKVRKRGGKILMWHGGADQLIPWRQSVHYYDDAAYRYKGYQNLAPWFRFFLAPGVTHCGGGVGPQPQGLFDVMVNWVENGAAPDSILSTATAASGLGSRPMCPYPQTAIFDGGDAKVASNWHCGSDLKSKETVCDELVTKFQKETLNSLDTNGLANPATCNADSNVPTR